LSVLQTWGATGEQVSNLHLDHREVPHNDSELFCVEIGELEDRK